MPMDNMKLWELARPVDPKYVKKVTQGKREFCSTNPTYRAKTATEVFGPCGTGWGFKVIAEGFQPGAPGLKNNTPTLLHWCRIKLWYTLGPTFEGTDDCIREIEAYGSTLFCGERTGQYNAGEPYTDEDAPKKSLTDAIGKALSMLGFGADIYMGLWDDDKYVAKVKAEMADKAKKTPAGAKNDPLESLI